MTRPPRVPYPEQRARRIFRPNFGGLGERPERALVEWHRRVATGPAVLAWAWRTESTRPDASVEAWARLIQAGPDVRRIAVERWAEWRRREWVAITSATLPADDLSRRLGVRLSGTVPRLAMICAAGLRDDPARWPLADESRRGVLVPVARGLFALDGRGRGCSYRESFAALARDLPRWARHLPPPRFSRGNGTGNPSRPERAGLAERRRALVPVLRQAMEEGATISEAAIATGCAVATARRALRGE